MSRRRVLLYGTGAAAALALASRRRLSSREPHPVLSGSPLLIAHRGGSALAPENTMPAFVQAQEQWGADMIELDVRASADGHCVVIHDATVDRTTDGTGAVATMTLAQLKRLDAGYHFTRDGGVTFPFRARGITISTIDEVFERLPHMRFTVEVKAGPAQVPLFAAIDRFGATQRVVAAGMYRRDRTLFDDYGGAISACREQLQPFYLLHRGHLARLTRFTPDVVQVPEWNGTRRLVTPRFVRDLHAHGAHVHVWTVNEPADMHRLLDWGVDGLVSDRPDLLGRVLQQRVGRAPAPGHAQMDG